MKRGFTLIELLMVVAIIAVLAGVILVAVGTVRQRGMEVKAKADLNQLLKAAELVYQQYGYYPNDSHGSIVCPRDIVVDAASGRTWGDFIQICEDPWGRPYEWNNKCESNGLTRKPHAPFDTNCPSFVDSDPGPVGILNLGSNGVDDGCTNDDICLGNRGYAVYGWSGDGGGGGGGPLCVNTVSACSGLSSLGCINRSGCTLGNSSCTGTFSTNNSCTSLADQTSCQAEVGCNWGTGGCSGTPVATCASYATQVSCDATSGCAWSSSSSCGGTASACSLATYGTQTSCQGVGCTWGTSASCSGSVTCSAYSANQTTCTASGCSYAAAACAGSYSCNQWNGTNATTCTTNHPGCTWSAGGGGKCNGGTLSCGSFSQSLCTPTGCSWGASSCTGAPSCGAFTQTTCQSTTGCSWSSSNSCTGSPNACASYGSSASCEASSGCSWSTSASCGGSANCNYGNSSSCSASAGCSWAASGCTGTYTTNSECSTFTDSSSCSAEATCAWSDGQCTGAAVSCTTFDQAQCTTQSGCSWQ